MSPQEHKALNINQKFKILIRECVSLPTYIGDGMRKPSTKIRILKMSRPKNNS